MEVVLTESSRDRLTKVALPPDKDIRISAAYEGGNCGCTVEVELRVDEIAQGDARTVADGISFIVDGPSRTLLSSDAFTLDYRESYGYVLLTRQETLAYGLKLAE